MHEHLHSHGRRAMAHDELHKWMVTNAQNKAVDNNKDSGDQGVATVVSVVYVTMSPSFSGSIAGYHTAGSDQTSTVAAAATTSSQAAAANKNSADSNTQTSETSQTAAKAASTTAASRSSSADEEDSQQTSQSNASSQTTLATISSSSGSNTVAAGTPLQQTRAAVTSTATPTSAPSTGMSGGAKAGVAFGVILGLALIAGIVLFALKKRRRQEEEGNHEKLADEKSGAGFGSMDATGGLSSSNSAPRLSLRPVTQFMGIGEPKVTEMTSATGGLNSFMPPAQQKRQSAWSNRPSTSRSGDVANPFGDSQSIDAEKAAEMNAMNAPIPVPAVAANPFSDNSSDGRPVSPEDMRTSPPSTPNSPPKAEIGTAAAVAVPKTQTSPKGPNNVHRVQLDFKPSMDDELDLHVGQVVRVVHEYDDGWVLCMRMDRSKQGVAPRQCLSKNPIKPRAPGPAPINTRPGSPSMRNGPPPQGRPGPGPGPRNNQMYPAPLSPGFNPATGGPMRPQSPASQQSRGRSHSQVSQGPRPNVSGSTSPPNSHRRSASMGQIMGTSPPKTGVPMRKPVPGQAM